MQSTKCLFSASTALHRVFIHPLEASTIQSFRLPVRRNLALNKAHPRLSKCLVIQCRAYSIQKPKAVQEIKRRFPRDNEIRNQWVFLVDEDGVMAKVENEEGELVPERKRTRAVLQSMNFETHHLVCVTMPSSDWTEPAICRIISNQKLAELKEREKEYEREAKKKNPVSVTKTLELNWAIGGNDLEHRLTKMREFLSKGNRLEVTISPKKRGRKASDEEAEALVARVRDVVVGVEGAKMGWKELKAMEGDLAGVAVLFFEGKVDAEAAAREKEAEKERKRMEEEEEEEADKKKAELKLLSAKQLAKREKWKKKEQGF